MFKSTIIGLLVLLCVACQSKKSKFDEDEKRCQKLIEMGHKALEDTLYDKAYKYYDSVTKIIPLHQEAWYHKTLYRFQKNEISVEDGKVAMTLSDTMHRIKLALFSMNSFNSIHHLQELQSIIENNPQYPNLWYQIGNFYSDLGFVNKATQAWTKEYQIHQNHLVIPLLIDGYNQDYSYLPDSINVVDSCLKYCNLLLSSPKYAEDDKSLEIAERIKKRQLHMKSGGNRYGKLEEE